MRGIEFNPRVPGEFQEIHQHIQRSRRKKKKEIEPVSETGDINASKQLSSRNVEKEPPEEEAGFDQYA